MAAGVRFRTPAAPILAPGVLALAVAAPAFSFIPVGIGARAGFFAQRDMAVETIAFGGGDKQHQAIAVGATDVAPGVGSGLS